MAVEKPPTLQDLLTFKTAYYAARSTFSMAYVFASQKFNYFIKLGFFTDGWLLRERIICIL